MNTFWKAVKQFVRLWWIIAEFRLLPLIDD